MGFVRNLTAYNVSTASIMSREYLNYSQLRLALNYIKLVNKVN